MTLARKFKSSLVYEKMPVKISMGIKLESSLRNRTMHLKEDKTTTDTPKVELAINQERSADDLESGGKDQTWVVRICEHKEKR